MNALPTSGLAAYGLLGMPLAMAALPLFVHVPQFYTATLGVPLATVGVLLLATRACDAIQDPLIGLWSDRWRGRRGGRWLFVALGTPGLALGMVALFSPPALSPQALAAWMAASLVVVYASYSLVTVGYQAHGAEIARDPAERTRVTAWREGFALAGVFLAITLPELLKAHAGERSALAQFTYGFAPLLVACAFIAVTRSPAAASLAQARPGSIVTPLRNSRFRALSLVYLANGIAAAIPATLVLFYIEDVLAAPALAPGFLLAYFAAGALGLPLWVRLARAWGKEAAWLAAMALAVAGFVWAFQLGPGDAAAFFAVCAITGLALGADLALPPSMLADVIDADERQGLARQEGAYFGAWNFLTKANLAIAAGLSLPLLAALGYVPREPGAGGARSLAAVYALLPCALKAVAIAALWNIRNQDRRNRR